MSINDPHLEAQMEVEARQTSDLSRSGPGLPLRPWWALPLGLLMLVGLVLVYAYVPWLILPVLAIVLAAALLYAWVRWRRPPS